MPGDFAEPRGEDRDGQGRDRRSIGRSPSSKRIASARPSDAGVWKLPHGDEYYAWALRAGTTTRMTPDEIHQLGQEELRELQSRDGRASSRGRAHAGHGRRAHDRARQAEALSIPARATQAARQIMAYLKGASPTCASDCRARSRRSCRATWRSSACRRKSSRARPARTAAPARSTARCRASSGSTFAR